MKSVLTIAMIILTASLSMAEEKVNSRDTNMGAKSENCPYRAQMDLFSSTNPDSKVSNKPVSQNGTDTMPGAKKKK
jgi:hypothetical protein